MAFKVMLVYPNMREMNMLPPAMGLLSPVLMYSPSTQVRATVAAETVVVSEERARLLEFQLAP